MTLQGPDRLLGWTPNTDSDTVGYDVFLASAPLLDGGACPAPALANALGTPQASMTVTDRDVSSYTVGPG